MRKFLAVTVLVLLTLVFASRPGGIVSASHCSAEQGQQYIYDGDYVQAIEEFTCVIDEDPTGVEGYRGRIEARLLLGLYADALLDYARVTALVEPVHTDVTVIILAGYSDRLATNPDDIPALTGASFARWYYFNYAQAAHLLNNLLEVAPDDPYGNLFRGSTRLLQGMKRTGGIADLEYAILLDPANPHVRAIVADAYTYGKSPDLDRAFAEATYALGHGVDTPRVRAMLAVAYNASGNYSAAAEHIETHIEMVTDELVPTAPLAGRGSHNLPLVPYRTYAVPLPAVAGDPLDISTSSRDFYDTIAVLLDPDGMPVLGSDDDRLYFADFVYTPDTTGTYLLLVTSFEAINTGDLLVSRR